MWKNIDKSITIRSVVVLTIIVMLSGCALLPTEEPPLAPPLVEPVKQNIVTVEVKRGTLEQVVRGSGSLEPYELSYHSFKSGGGRIAAIHVRAGQEVKRGDLLVELEVEGLDLELKYKALNLEKAKQDLEAAKASMNPDEMRVKLIQLDIAQTEYDMTRQKLDDKRLVADRDGVVTFITNKEPPDFVNAHENIVVVADADKLQIIVTKSENNWASGIKVGMEEIGRAHV